MTWSIADAKRQFSEVVRLSAEEPQTIYDHGHLVAAVVSNEEFEEFRQWQRSRRLMPSAEKPCT